MKNESEVAQLWPTLSDPMDGSLPGSSVHGIFQARVLEWGAIAFSGSSLVELWDQICLQIVGPPLGREANLVLCEVTRGPVSLSLKL